jgi:hypothetical protein
VLLQRIAKPLRSAHPSGAAQQPQVAVTQASASLLGIQSAIIADLDLVEAAAIAGPGRTKEPPGFSWIANQLSVRFPVIGSERECSECFYHP